MLPPCQTPAWPGVTSLSDASLLLACQFFIHRYRAVHGSFSTLSFQPLHIDLIILACFIHVRKCPRAFCVATEELLFSPAPLKTAPWSRRRAFMQSVPCIAQSESRNDCRALPAAGYTLLGNWVAFSRPLSGIPWDCCLCWR